MRVNNSGFRIWGTGFRCQVYGFRNRISALWIQISGISNIRYHVCTLPFHSLLQPMTHPELHPPLTTSLVLCCCCRITCCTFSSSPPATSTYSASTWHTSLCASWAAQYRDLYTTHRPNPNPIPKTRNSKPETRTQKLKLWHQRVVKLSCLHERMCR